MVGHKPLELGILVRIQVPQQNYKSNFLFEIFFEKIIKIVSNNVSALDYLKIITIILLK